MAFTLWLLVVFLVVRYIVPRVLRAVLGSFVRQQVYRAQQAGGAAFDPLGGFGNSQANQQTSWTNTRSSQPGQVHVEYVPSQAKKARQSEFKGGEYVDYEEVR
ncbi:MAG: DUF4834 family protein [Hymenobacter sp.]|nr:MAG: DUF4834 family protein [Hymenobacter sp.]